ncbi:protein of unknown function (plasmid) [Agrobacterium pusense]|uniref:Uncharacterized protein n=1 Tax=Agrobacterium pusense TaxID=648995 RepID=U4QEK9_9HYPH|nr:protein of unknown function [Agrobacterium pusense]
MTRSRDGSRRQAIGQVGGVHCDLISTDETSVRPKAPHRFINLLGNATDARQYRPERHSLHGRASCDE